MSKTDASIAHPTPQPPRTEHRRHPRRPVQTVVLIYWTDSAGLPQDACAVIRDVSARGFGIETDRRFLVGQSITVRAADCSLECTVRHMQEYPNSFLAGLEIVSSSDGSSLECSLASLCAAIAP